MIHHCTTGFACFSHTGLKYCIVYCKYCIKYTVASDNMLIVYLDILRSNLILQMTRSMKERKQ